MTSRYPHTPASHDTHTWAQTRPGVDDLEPTPIEGLHVGVMVRRSAENYEGAPVGVVIALYDATELTAAFAAVRMADGTEWSGSGRAWTVVGLAPEGVDDPTGRLVTAARAQDRVRKAETVLARLTMLRDDAIRAALEGGDTGTRVAAATDMTRARVYQIRDHRR